MKAGFGALAACMLVLTTCGSAGPKVSGSGSPGAIAHAGYSPTPTSASSARTPAEPTPSAIPTPVTPVAGLNCTLPVSMEFDYGDGTLDDPYRLPIGPNSLVGGFLTLPAGQLLDDPGSLLASGARTTIAQPVLHGEWPGPVFDRQANRWVPAMNPHVVSPDGSMYVYAPYINEYVTNSTSTIHVVIVRTGNDRLLYSSGRTDMPIAWTKDGIYIVDKPADSSGDGLRLINPYTGAARVIESSRAWDFVANGFAWGTGPSGSTFTGYSPHVIDRLDVASGAVTTWYTVPSSEFVWIVAIDLLGHPIIAVSSGSGYYVPGREARIFRLDAPSHAIALFTTNTNIDKGLVDSHGLWFIGHDVRRGDVWFYADGVGLHEVAVAPIGRSILATEGPCV